MRLYCCASLLAPCAMLLLAAQVQADFVDHPHPLPTSSALPGFHGSTHWALSGGIRHLDANVDYAVFTPFASADPHQYPRDLANLVPYSSFVQTFGPPKPTDYLYAYEIYNNTNSNDNFLFLSVGIDSDQLINSLARDLGADPGGIDAALAFLGSDGAKYFMFFGGQGHELAPGEHSVVLIMSSPYAPTFRSSYIFSASGMTGEAFLPSPIPTPTAAIAGLVGLLSLAAWKLPRRQ
ncbi:MAG: hypothetical protein NTU53_25220 [Planctomycetota bacterium]|nr:hypothetical protein [Planctomycetota bacterium]